MDGQDSFELLAQRLRAGDEDAAAEIVHRYGQRLIALARSILDTRIRRVTDADDLVQSVYRSFFMRHNAGQFQVPTWTKLWALLTVLTRRKCIDRIRHTKRERSLTAPLDADEGQPDDEPGPEEPVILIDTIDQAMRGYEPDERKIIELSLQGFTTDEISGQLGRTKRTVRRVREHVKRRLFEMQTADV